MTTAGYGISGIGYPTTALGTYGLPTSGAYGSYDNYMPSMMGMNGSVFGASAMMNPMMNPMFSGNPFAMNQSFGQPMKDNSNGAFNVDELVKRIDAKIAELEEEERKEKEIEESSKKEVIEEIPNNAQATTVAPTPIEPNTMPSAPIATTMQQGTTIPREVIVNKETDTVNIADISQENKQPINAELDDDNFFDDFFADE